MTRVLRSGPLTVDSTTFLTYDEFRKNVADKRGKTVAMADINMIRFDDILYRPGDDVYYVDVSVAHFYRRGYSFRTHRPIADNTHIMHWGQWLCIGIMTKLHPELLDAYFFVTNINAAFTEPCFIDMPLPVTLSLEREKYDGKKHEFTFFILVNDWVLYVLDFTVMEEEPAVLDHYWEKHGGKDAT